VSLLNEVGTTIDTFSDATLNDPSQKPGYWFRKMERLYELARRAALGSDKILDDVISQLDDDVPF
jgi:hypothetical protein